MQTNTAQVNSYHERQQEKSLHRYRRPSSPAHTNPNGNKKIDIQAAPSTGSPEVVRLNHAEKKVTSLADGNLRGGNFVLDCDGKAATLAFAFEKDGGIYSLTAGHLADIGDAIFVFLISTKTPNDFDDSESYEMIEVGEVVSKNIDTDSLIFRIENPYLNGKVDLLKLVPEAGLADSALQLPEPDANPVPPRMDTKVVVYGAMRRGEAGHVVVASKPYAGMVSKKGDVGISSVGDGVRPFTSGGDCGSLYVTEDGLAIAMHHCLRGTEAPYTSFGIPLAAIFTKHSLLGGEQEAIIAESQQRSESDKIAKSPKDKHPESRNITKFDTKITKVIPPLGVANLDDPDVYESRDIAYFEDVRVVKK